MSDYWIIESIELRDYHWTKLSGMKHFRIDYERVLQLILATNGAGKSSLMRQLNPLPADRVDFGESGLKRIVMRNNSRRYALTSDFTLAKPHSFKDLSTDEELNPGGTITVQRELVHEAFGVNQKIMDLLLGNVRFTSMSAALRKEWVYRLDSGKREYLISLYDSARQRFNELQGAIKLEKKRLIKEVDALASDAYILSLSEEVDALQHTVSAMTELKEAVRPNEEYRSLINRIKAVNAQIASLYATLIKSIASSTLDKAVLSDMGACSEAIDSFQAEAQLLANEISGYKGALVHVTDALEKSRARAEFLRNTNAETVKKSEEIKAALIKKRNELNTLIEFDFSDCDLNEASGAFDGINAIIYQLCETLSMKGDRVFTKVALDAAREDRVRAESQLSAVDGKIGNLELSIKHQEDHERNPDLTCPKCEHRYSNQYNPVLVASYKRNIEKLNIEREAIRAKLKALDVYIEECSEYGKTIARLKDVLSAAKSKLGPFVAHLINRNVFVENPRAYGAIANAFRLSLDYAIEIAKIDQALKPIEETIQVFSNGDTTALGDVEQRCAELTAEFNALHSKLRVAESKAESARTSARALKRIMDLHSEVSALFKTRSLLRKSALRDISKRAKSDALKELQAVLGCKVYELNTVLKQKSVVDNITARIEELEESAKEYEILINELSPTTGLIAETLGGFINGLIGHMNEFIGAIWTYPLKLLPFKLDASELVNINYKFPFQADTLPYGDDVSKGSSSITEIIDLAFRVVAMQYMKLKFNPLNLDEFGKGFDARHAHLASHVIADLVDSGAFSQFFVISHNHAAYSGLSNAEVLVLHGENIEKPSFDYNGHLTVIA